MSRARAAATTGAKRARLSAIELLMFFRENDSDAAPNTATSCAPAAAAASKPCMFGTSTGYATPGLRRMRAITSALSAICGTHFGDTNAVASTAGRPASDRRSISSTLIAVGIVCFSFCRPSRGPTSTIFTCCRQHGHRSSVSMREFALAPTLSRSRGGGVLYSHGSMQRLALAIIGSVICGRAVTSVAPSRTRPARHPRSPARRRRTGTPRGGRRTAR